MKFKVSILTDTDAYGLERQMNLYLNGVSGEIISIKYSTCPMDHYIEYSAMIIFKD